MNTQAFLNSTQAREVFRRHNIAGSGIDAVRRGFAVKGDFFMYDLMKSITPKTSVLRGNFGDNGEMGPPTFDQWTEQQADKPKRTLEQWMEIFGTAATTIGALKQNIFGNGTSEPADTTTLPAAKSSNTIIYIVAAVVVLAIAFLIYKQSK